MTYFLLYKYYAFWINLVLEKYKKKSQKTNFIIFNCFIKNKIKIEYT